MKLLMFSRNDGPVEPGLPAGDAVISVAGPIFSELMSIFGSSEMQASVAEYAAAPPSVATASLASVRIKAPITNPEKNLCVGLNYRDHAMESNMAIP